MTNLIDDIGNEQSRYCYPNTDILINKKDIKDPILLESVERIITAYKLAILNSGDYSNINQTWNYDHFMSIHKFLFDELYDFAGEVRRENMFKSIWFIPTVNASIMLTEMYEQVFKNYDSDLAVECMKISKYKTREELIKEIADRFLDLNVIHIFREGNGRTTREFLREYVEEVSKKTNLNYEIDYKLMTDDIKAKYLEASIKDNNALAYDVFDSIIVKKEYENEKGFSK